ncbi:YjbF family lipoprotein [Thalassococcus lentus]|uniref:YjbF family lipoprotein n=1 Tax=Thalassococcus lentus TaxID=1210524 RepID=A0ABT4XN28_9RHOB|nr:YjbF family lipoprotein [Thalassococcus lentus]MDA7423344.1 YjbF family lipoprotein [Thalassococcus lentus]
MTGLIKTATAFAAVLALSACGNGNRDAAAMLKAIPAAFAAKKAGPVGVSAEQMSQVLASTQAPVNLFVWESTKAQFLMVEIERNRGHQSFGNAARQLIVIKDGVITGSRGLGGDLMSSDADALISQVRRRTAGNVPYTMRFLTPEDVTTTMNLNCAVTPLGQQVPVQAGEVNGTGEAVNAVCSNADGYTVTNTFIVDGHGRILTTRQWISQTIGFLTVQPLRL